MDSHDFRAGEMEAMKTMEGSTVRHTLSPGSPAEMKDAEALMLSMTEKERNSSRGSSINSP